MAGRAHPTARTSQSPVTVHAGLDIRVGMDNATPQPDTPDEFDIARITGDIDALADQHAGHEDVFRAALAQLLKAELLKARQAAQATLMRDRHGRHCAERLCYVQDEIIRMLFSAATRHLYHSPIPSGAERI